jgi:hypothetical protein
MLPSKEQLLEPSLRGVKPPMVRRTENVPHRGTGSATERSSEMLVILGLAVLQQKIGSR